MYATKFLVSLLLTLICAKYVHARYDNQGLYVTIINGTPFKWTKTGTYKNRVDGYIPQNEQNDGPVYEWEWPEVLESGVSHETFIRWERDRAPHPYGRAECHVTYKLEGTSKPMSFKLRADESDSMIYVSFLEELDSIGNPKGSVIKLGYDENVYTHYYPGHAFILAGDEGFFVSSNPPVAWMQATLDTIGNLTLRELILPASHNSGMSKITSDRGGREHISQTQTLNIYDQLKLGVRILDIRPSWWINYDQHPYDKTDDPGPQVRTSNFRPNEIKVWIGATGLDLADIVAQVNQFNNDFPGELIFIHIKFMDWFFKDVGKKWNHLTHELMYLEHRQTVWLPASGPGSDLGTYRVRNFIGDGKSSVIVLMPKTWLQFYHNQAPGYLDDHLVVKNNDTLDYVFYSQHHREYYGITKDGPLHSKDDPYPLDLSHVLPLTETRNIHSAEQTVDHVDISSGDRTKPTVGNIWQGFYIHDHFVWHNEYADMNELGFMAAVQGTMMDYYRTSPYDEPFMLKWILTQWREENGPGVADEDNNGWTVQFDMAKMKYQWHIHEPTGYGTWVNGRIHNWLWNWVEPGKYPNGIEVDNIRNSQITALAMGLQVWLKGKYDKPWPDKSDDFIRAAQAAISEVYSLIDQETQELEAEDDNNWQEYLATMGPGPSEWKVYPWAKFKGDMQRFWHRLQRCTDDPTYGRICGSDD